ncbi:MAG: FAD-dependent monooxygenase [Candidatus Acidiferrum sp.]
MHILQRRIDVFIIGGGPAGLAAAIAARRRGLSVTVADGGEPPIDKACGEGLMPETVAALKDLDVEVPTQAGYRLQGLRFVQGESQVSANFPEGQGVGIRRTVLHELLIRHAERCGVKMLWRTPVAGIDGDGVLLGRDTIRARWIVGADGGQSRARRWSKLNLALSESHRFANRRHYHLRPWSDFAEVHWGSNVQAYVTPVGREEVCVVAMGATVDAADFQRVLEVLPELRERLAGAELCSRERGAVAAMQALARVWRGNVALVGDASGGVDAITGEGLRLAFRQAHALAKAMQHGDLREYGWVHRRLARRPLWMGRLMLQWGRHDWMRSRTLKMLSQHPGLFARLLAIHLGRASTGDVVSTGAQLGWRFLAS